MQKRASAALRARRARAARPTSLKKRIKTVAALALLAVLSVGAVAIVYLLVVFVQVSRSIPSLAEIGAYQPSEGTRIYYSDGAVMAVLATENRRPVKLKEVSRYLIDATIAVEDKRFYEHGGVDYYGIARAIYRNLTGGDITAQGASTISQQLARNINELGLTRRKLVTRKIAEAILAQKLEQAYSKDEILELYLNQIYYGNGAYGIEAASRAYFHRSARDLNLAQAAMLAGLPQRPSIYSEDRDAANRRRDWVLDRMVENNKITEPQRDAARAQTLRLYKASARGTRVYGAPHFVNYVVGQLVRAYGYDSVYSGWKVYTTLDSRIQKAAEQTLRSGLREYARSANQAALVCLDPRTGYIRAMVGGVDFGENQYNYVLQGAGRPPGSAFKPIVYTAAFDTGTADLDKTYRDDPNLGIRTTGGWRPKNYDGGYSYRSRTVRNAIKWSLNTIAVKCAIDTGLTKVIEYAHRLGISADIPAYPPIALGAVAVRPIELCSAYSLFANGGRRAVPMGIRRVEAANGDIIQENEIQMDDPGLKPETVQQINEALQEVVQGGTGAAASGVPGAHGKTGTTSDNRDTWFCGYTPDLATVIWACHERRVQKGKTLRIRYDEMPGATGGHSCAPIWRDFMLKAVPIQQAANKASARGAAAPAAPPKAEPPKPPRRQERAGEAARAPRLLVPASEPAESQPFVPTPLADPSAPVVVSPPPPNVSRPAPAPTAAAPPAAPAYAAPEPGVGAVRPSATSRPSEPSGRLSAPLARTDPGDDWVTIRVCADSGRLATRWCDATIERRVRRSSIPGRCRLHRPPPGER